MRTRFIFALVLLTACTQTPQQAEPVFRDQTAQIASQTDVTPARMAGDWAIRQRYAGGAGPQSGWQLETQPDGSLVMSVAGGDCIDGACFSTSTSYLLVPTGPGRWTIQDPPAGFPSKELWVMWMDFDSRTAAIGTPSGAFGWIMDKSVTGGGDRITAARDIMDWFGYDLGQLQTVGS